MKIRLTCVFVFLFFCAKSQNNLLLLKGGAQLEYRSYTSSEKGSGEYKEGTRLIFAVDSVRQNGGETISYITKKGIASNKADENYTISYTLKSNGNSIQLPFQFYFVDTMYRADFYPDTKQSGHIIGCSYSKKFISLTIPFVLTDGQVLATDRKLMNVSYVVLDSTGRKWPVPMEYEIRKVTIEGKETITTKAGTFECYKIKMKGTIEVATSLSKMEKVMYYSEKAGLVKWQEQESYTELVEIK